MELSDREDINEWIEDFKHLEKEKSILEMSILEFRAKEIFNKLLKNDINNNYRNLIKDYLIIRNIINNNKIENKEELDLCHKYNLLILSYNYNEEEIIKHIFKEI